MFVSRLSVIILLLSIFAVPADGQEPHSYVVWGTSPTCGAKNLSTDSVLIACSRTVNGNVETYILKHDKLSLSMRYWWYTSYIRIWTEVENGHDESIPVDVKSWSVKGYESFAAFNANEKPLFSSQAETPEDGIARGGRRSVGVPSSLGGSSTLPDGGADPQRSIAPIPVVAETKRPSAMKWKEIRPRSKQAGEVRFDTNPDARYLRINLNLNGTNYIYSLEKPKS